MLKNSKGKVYYGMHFYPGVAEYQEPGKEAYRVFLNEDTLRTMDPSFAGRPVFVEHVDGVEEDIDELRKEADGWVIESFFNQADGKHWVKMLIVSERGERAIKAGLRLSNAYFPTSFANGGLWNGVAYSKEITSGEFDHLAIVKNPRYEESVILTPESFKKYNSDKMLELEKLKNSKKENTKMGLNFFKRAKVENGIDADLMVVLPKSKKEMSVANAIDLADKVENMHGYADGEHRVKVGNDEMSVNDLVKKHMDAMVEMEGMKDKKEDASEEDVEVGTKDKSVDVEGDDKSVDNEDEDDAEKKLDMEKKKNAADAEAKKKADAKVKAERLKNAHLKALENDSEPEAKVEFSADRVQRGKQRYGS